MRVVTEQAKPETEIVTSLGSYNGTVSINIEVTPDGDDWVVGTLRKGPNGKLVLELAQDIDDSQVATNDLGQIIVVDENGNTLN